MQEEEYYSVRMRAAKNTVLKKGGKHISGGEVLSTYSNIKQSVNALLEKALTHSRGKPDFMQIQFESINESIKLVKPLRVETNEVETVENGKTLARAMLEKSGVPKRIIDKAYKQIPEYSSIRGAILFDIHSGERIDNNSEKGVRVSRIDWLNANFEKWTDENNQPKSSRVKEALAIATKVCDHPSTIAELCWSDDPDYVTGYVANKKLGYQRITRLKEYGDEQGCRIFFVDGVRDLPTYINFLEKKPIFIKWEEDDIDT
ncbi:6-carboxyhexanoate--CoA ligase [Salipaludibacillus neizhouensis]|uniref:6-carboxyhexanoate--CoA ligase n=1 Tax=Salipaludibacillus neizhouensis TaxID=885475 RepID=A0A3A9K3L5_9BACI|nr:6-carboxyhexanoate--CoA ligase [Salipaludibacillus neizhouensis]RKL64871.1 6-carboxyhexanoate--CoA ligase [Salipaludibacillus neizhouensis]